MLKTATPHLISCLDKHEKKKTDGNMKKNRKTNMILSQNLLVLSVRLFIRWENSRMLKRFCLLFYSFHFNFNMLCNVPS